MVDKIMYNRSFNSNFTLPLFTQFSTLTQTRIVYFFTDQKHLYKCFIAICYMSAILASPAPSEGSGRMHCAAYFVPPCHVVPTWVSNG